MIKVFALFNDTPVECELYKLTDKYAYVKRLDNNKRFSMSKELVDSDEISIAIRKRIVEDQKELQEKKVSETDFSEGAVYRCSLPPGKKNKQAEFEFEILKENRTTCLCLDRVSKNKYKVSKVILAGGTRIPA